MEQTNTTLHISLPSALKQRVEERVRVSGSFSNASDYIRSLIRADIERSAEERLEVLLLEGIASGEPAPLSLGKVREMGCKKAETSGARGV